MSLFTTITKGMADGAEALQANFAKLATAITSIGDDGTMTVPKLSVDNLAVSGDVPNTTLSYNSGYSGGASYYYVRNKTVHMFISNAKGFTATGQRAFEVPSSLQVSIPGTMYFAGMYGTGNAVVGFNGTQVYISTSSVSYNANTTLNAYVTWQLP